MKAARTATVLVLLVPPAESLCAYSSLRSTMTPACTVHRSHAVVMMGKKTSWSIGTARKKEKRQKASKPTRSQRAGTSAKGFGITKEKLAKTLGEMSVAEAIGYLSGPEPRKAGISDVVVAALRSEILAAVVEAKRTAAKRSSEEAITDEEAIRKWREYCAQALAAAEKLDANADSGMEPAVTDATSQSGDPPLFKPLTDDPSLFKPSGEKSEQSASPLSTSNQGVGEASEDGERNAPEDVGGITVAPPIGFDWVVGTF